MDENATNKYTSPLKWVLNDKLGIRSASTPFGTYYVERYGEGHWKWSYCFDEYYDEGWYICFSPEDGENFAQMHWDERVQPILISREEAQAQPSPTP